MTFRQTLLAFSAAVALTTFGGAAKADIIISGNSAGFGNGAITTFDFTTGAFIGSFVPDGALPSNNGRGLAVTNNEFFYTELGSDPIHIAPYNGGAGGHDIGTFPNPAPGQGIQDLAFGKAGLYVLTGYPTSSPVVYLLNPTNGSVISSVALQSPPASPTADGFTVLSDGSFIANLADGANTNLYQHFDAAGNAIGSPFAVPGATDSTGVDIAPDGMSLFYATDFNSITQTDLANNLITRVTVPYTSPCGVGDCFEDIGVQQPFTPPPPNAPEPATLAVLGVALVGLGLARRKRT